MLNFCNMYTKATNPVTGDVFCTGWLPPVPDLRDYNEINPEIAEMDKMMKIPTESKAPSFPEKIDLRPYCTEVEDQKNLGSCTAHAAIGIAEYLQKRAFAKHIEGSRLFVYKATRNLMGVIGDTGAWLRTTMGALVLCGIPSEKYWPYTDRKQSNPNEERTFDDEPPSFVYAIADNYESLKYFCHDPLGMNVPPKEVLMKVKKYLAAGIPSMFGFYGFRSFGDSDITGGIPYPCPNEAAIWGHAVAAVGYDDNIKIKNIKCNRETKGALLIRNSWGTDWGDKGYGWLPYDYVHNKLALDFWSLLGMEWVETGQFGL